MLFAVEPRDSACVFHRVSLPLRYMGIPRTNDITKASVVFFNRVPHVDLGALLGLKKKYGFKIVMDLDDYWYLYPHHYLYATWNLQYTPERIIGCLSVADTVLCTTTRLADKIMEYNKNVHVVPNGLPYGDGQFKGYGGLRVPGNFGFVGGPSHGTDIKRIPGCKLPGKLPLERYMEHYRGLSLCYAPLEDNFFNSFKSNLKLLEAGVNGTACMASPVAPFTDDKRLAEAVIYSGDRDWTRRIGLCLDDPKWVKEMGEQLGALVREHYDLRNINKLRKELLLA